MVVSCCNTETGFKVDLWMEIGHRDTFADLEFKTSNHMYYTLFVSIRIIFYKNIEAEICEMLRIF